MGAFRPTVCQLIPLNHEIDLQSVIGAPLPMRQYELLVPESLLPCKDPVLLIVTLLPFFASLRSFVSDTVKLFLHGLLYVSGVWLEFRCI
jgi:hypothetical protein